MWVNGKLHPNHTSRPPRSLLPSQKKGYLHILVFLCFPSDGFKGNISQIPGRKKTIGGLREGEKWALAQGVYVQFYKLLRLGREGYYSQAGWLSGVLGPRSEAGAFVEKCETRNLRASNSSPGSMGEQGIPLKEGNEPPPSTPLSLHGVNQMCCLSQRYGPHMHMATTSPR